MKYDSRIYHRQSIRLRGYDYARSGGYYVTIVTLGRVCFFGEIHNAEIILNKAGEMVAQWWTELPRKFPSIMVDAFVVMPNHFHGILIIHNEPVGAGLVPAPLVPAQGIVSLPSSRATTRVAPTLGEIVGAFKSITTVEYIRGVKQYGWRSFEGRLWQRNFYEHILRNQADWERIAAYILANPSQWIEDEENPASGK